MQILRKDRVSRLQGGLRFTIVAWEENDLALSLQEVAPGSEVKYLKECSDGKSVARWLTQLTDAPLPMLFCGGYYVGGLRGCYICD